MDEAFFPKLRSLSPKLGLFTATEKAAITQKFRGVDGCGEGRADLSRIHEPHPYLESSMTNFVSILVLTLSSMSTAAYAKPIDMTPKNPLTCQLTVADTTVPGGKIVYELPLKLRADDLPLSTGGYEVDFTTPTSDYRVYMTQTKRPKGSPVHVGDLELDVSIIHNEIISDSSVTVPDTKSPEATLSSFGTTAKAQEQAFAFVMCMRNMPNQIKK